MSQNLNALKIAILEDGKIDAEEVTQISAVIWDDGKIDRDEADFLFALNDGKKEAVPEWTTLFVKAISAHLLEDADSPGEIDADEAKWLTDKIMGDGKVDEVERALMTHLAGRGALPKKLADL
ncbi:MAG: hypothetical protein ACI9VR_004441 [Cognaticolwellia sp.]|jgi:hypothetical protein